MSLVREGEQRNVCICVKCVRVEAVSMDDLSRKRRVRGGHKASAKKLVAKIVEAIATASPESPETEVVWLRQSRSTLRDKVKTIKELDEQIVDLLSASKEENVDELVVKEIGESDEAIAEFERTLIGLDDALRKLGEQSTLLMTPTQSKATEQNLDDSQVSSSSIGKVIRAKLPKLHLRNFSGKICEWPEFWDGFSSSIDDNDQLSDVDKFAYLRGFLEGPAKATIAGLSLTGANYKCAVDLLKKRFEKKNEVQRAHINELINLPAVYRERDTHRLRKLYDSCEAHNRALRALGVSEESYSTIVVPIIMEKLPEQFRLAITRGTNFLEWSMKEMLEAYEKELELREAHYPVGFNSMEKDLERNSGKKYGHQGSTAAALLASEKKNCAFCLKNHAHEKCDGVVDPKTRKNIARKYGRCFLCLVKGHRASNCSLKVKCKNCNGSHHVALCEASSKDKTHAEKTTEIDNESKQVNTNVHVTSPNSNLHVGTGSLVALQTARGVLRGQGRLRCGYSLMGEVIAPLLLRKRLVLRVLRV